MNSGLLLSRKGNIMTKFFNYLRKHHFRLIDSHIGIAGAHLFVKILAVWGGTTLYLLSVQTMSLFSLSWQYHFSSTYYPSYTFEISILGKKIIDTGRDAKRLTSESVDLWIAEKNAKKEAARERIKDIDPEAVREIHSTK